MKFSKFPFILSAIILFASCVQEESEGVVAAGDPVEINLSLRLADADGPDVTLSTSNSSAAKAYSSNGASTQSSDAALKVTYSGPKKTGLRATTTLNNVWVLQFDSTGVIGTAGNCVAAKYLGTVAAGANLNPKLVSGSGQVIYVLANGPASGSITTSTYTLTTFKESAAFSGTITDDLTIPYIGRIRGGFTVSNDSYIKDFTTVMLQRMVAKVSLNLNFNVTGLTLQSVKLYNAPLNMYYLYGSDITTFPATPSASDINASAVTANVVPSTASYGTYIWYTGENKRGENSAITSVRNKYSANTPGSSAYCSYVRITAVSDDGRTRYYYDLYLGANGTTDFNVKRNWEYVLSASITGTADLQASYDVLDGRISSKLFVSNCYIVSPSDAITIPVNVKGNGGDVAGTGLSTTHTATSVGVLWQTSAGLVTASDFNASAQTVKITAGTGSGNAVIAAYDADGTTILWSWHIWVTNYEPNTSFNDANYTYNGHTWMDRNLGATTTTASTATTFGMHYQWGRKDPFPNSTSATTSVEPTLVGAFTSVTKTVVTTSSSNLPNTILNPVTFYYGLDPSYDWYSVSTGSAFNNALWGGASLATPTTKTIFDPCPAGWRVPAFASNMSPWNMLDATTFPWTSNGRVYTAKSTYYPAAGGRQGSSGEMAFIGTYGHYWSASVYGDSQAQKMYFYSTALNSESRSNRAVGQSVRCVQE
jgi:hypothetical protein